MRSAGEGQPYPTWRLYSTMRIAMGCYETVVLGIPRPCTARGVSTGTGEQLVVTEEQEEMHVECSSGIIGRPRHGGTPMA